MNHICVRSVTAYDEKPFAGWYCCRVQMSDGMLGSMGNGHRKRVKHFDEPGHCHELTFSC